MARKDGGRSMFLRCKRGLLAVLLGLVAPCAAQNDPAQPAGANNRSVNASVPPAIQPIPFSHKTHAGVGLTCEFCHQNPDPGNQLTFPPTARCMSCHSVIAKDVPAIRKLAQFAKDNQPVPWVRVYAVPAFVYWSHRTHFEAGMNCAACHGQVDQMDTMARVTNVTTMGGCVECHRQREASTGCKTCHESQSSWLRFPPPAGSKGGLNRAIATGIGAMS
jgi:Zn ribbon nucleic-acid-binding protein